MIIVSKLGFCLKLFRENLTWLLLNLLEENVFGSNSTLHADFVATVDQRKIHRHWNSPFRFPSLVVLFLRFIQIYQNCIIEISYCLPSNQPQTGLVLLLCWTCVFWNQITSHTMILRKKILSSLFTIGQIVVWEGASWRHQYVWLSQIIR